MWRATEALAAIPGRFDRLLICAQLSHTRSTRRSIAETIRGARTTVSLWIRIRNSNSPPGRRDDMWRAMEALAAIPGRFDRLLTCAQLSHTRSACGPSARTIPWAPNHRFVLISNSNSNSPPGGQDDVWRAMEALAAIPGRFDRLLTCAQLSHTRSTRGSAVKCQNLPMKDLILTLVT